MGVYPCFIGIVCVLRHIDFRFGVAKRQCLNFILLYKGLKGKARIPTDDLILPTASKDAYLKSFFPQTIRDWNVLPDSLISSAELSDDCVSRFTSLVRARD